MTITFTIRRWLDSDKFSELMEIADYLGREEYGSKFQINVNKIVSRGYNVEKVLEILEDVGVHLSSVEIRHLENMIRSKYKVTLEWLGNDVILKTNIYLKNLQELNEYMTYNKSLKAFIVKPFKLFELKNELSKYGIYVDDKTGIQESMKLPFNIEFKGELREYQKEALDSWIDKGMKGIIALPTGSGKTVIAIAALARLRERTLIVTYTKEQMFQWADMICKFTNIPRAYIGLYYGEEKQLSPITISTYQTAYRHIKRISRFFSFLIIDECHHLPADKFKHIAINSFATKRMGLSATVVREDGKHEELFPLMGGIAYFKTPSELSMRGYLAPFQIIPVYVELTDDELEEYKEMLRLYRNLAGGLKFQEVLANAKKGDEKAIQALKVHNKLKQIVHKSRSKLEAVRRIVNRELLRGSKILIFTQYVDQAEEIGKLLNAPVLTGETEDRLRRRILEDFKEGKSRVLVVTTVGDEGLDIPDVNVGIIVTGTGSRRQFVQRLGRLLRPGEGKEARLYEIIVKGTAEEYISRRRKRLSIDELVGLSLSTDVSF